MARLLRLLLLCLWPLGPLWASDILLVGGEDQPGIRSFVAAVESHRPQDRVRFQTTADLPRPGRLKADQRLVLLDSAALEWRLSESAGPPALAMRVSRVQAEQRLGKSRPAFLTLLWSDPPLARQLRLARYLLPQAQRIGVLYGKHSAFLLDELRHAARPLGLEIIAQDWPDPRDSRPLQYLLGNSDVLLGLDDPALYNPKTAKNLLLSSYGRQMALIGPNAGFVRAGALASTYSDQDDWLAVLDHLLDQPPARWPRSLYPARYGVSGNQQVARALGLEPIDPNAAAKALAEGESTP
ncbi:ABC transporter substrate-binding protein [Pseudomonas sp. SWRI59]|uniref:ABC transporter substrate-binding protein n=1 Tax=Pseudomonas TaxID=286 RepID=UPI000BA3886E|nr:MULTISPECIES: ABC transporter substrate-binding protein [unclassified Pseudomonas]MBC3481505.1 ABC transporter substrate-binding protein [Pseudomonas sp. SWRI77]MBC3502245.1 ABC transporter substrate-binding protein [Pseudomonas sp. SWRI59]MBC3506143.1 ABC transporter substrate-binding protein [Pseudomonas sp. SWRI68]UVL02383.1 ABC transporter substrate-binding protein [Pseudomonas sp. B21-047]